MPTLRQIMGLDYMVGADGTMGGGGVSPAMNPGQPHVVQLPDRGPRGLLLGFGPTSVNAAASQVFNAQPSLVFRASRLMALAAVASLFSITDFRIGRNTQLVSSNAVPAAAFAEQAVDSGLRGDTCTVGQLISLTVLNNAAGALTFSGALFGVANDG